MKMHKLTIDLLLIALMSIGGYFAYLNFIPQSGLASKYSQTKTRKEKAWPVRAKKAVLGNHNIYRTVFGTINAPRITSMSFQIAGCIQTVPDGLRAGQVINKGQILAKLDTRKLELDVNTAQLSIDELEGKQVETKGQINGLKRLQQLNEEQLSIAQASFERKEKLSGRGVTSTKTMDEAKQILSEAKRQLLSNQNKRVALGLSLKTLGKQAAIAKENLKSVVLKLSHAELYAPHDGRISKTALLEGSCVSPMSTVLDLVDISKIEVSLSIPVQMYADLPANNLQEQSLEVFSNRKKLGVARLLHVLPLVDETDGFATLVFEFDNSSTLIAGQDIHARILVERLSDVVELPSSALFADRYIYRIGDQRLAEIRVVPVARNSESFFVKDEIEEGDIILTSHINQAAPDLLVKVLATEDH